MSRGETRRPAARTADFYRTPRAFAPRSSRGGAFAIVRDVDMDEDTSELDEVTFGDALAELHPFVGREYAVVLVDSISGSFIMTAAGHLNSVQGDDDFAMILLGPDNDVRIDLDRNRCAKSGARAVAARSSITSMVFASRCRCSADVDGKPIPEGISRALRSSPLVLVRARGRFRITRTLASTLHLVVRPRRWARRSSCSTGEVGNSASHDAQDGHHAIPLVRAGPREG